MLKAIAGIAAFFALTTSLTFGEEAECNAESRCIEDQALRLELTRARIRGKVANVSLLLTNQTTDELELSIRGEYLSATTYEGERLRLTSTRDKAKIIANGTRSLAYSLEFENPIGDGFDLVLTFEDPDSSYAFFDVQNYQ